MRYRLLLPALAVAGSVPAQGPALATEVLDPSRNFVRAQTSGGQLLNLPAGPVAFPVHLETSAFLPARATLHLDQTLSGPTTTLSITESAAGGNSHYGLSECLLRNTVAMPFPARVTLAIAPSVAWNGFSIPIHDAAVDIGADGSPEYSYTYSFPTAPAPGTVEFLADSRGTPLDVEARSILGGGGVGTFTAQLDLQFTAPQQEPAYGSACGAELGCQLDPANPFARTLVASLPGSSILAWFIGGDQQANILVPGFACPLLTNNAVVISVPLVPAANGRSMAVLDVVLPPLPGAVWFAQGAAFAGGTFAGTNGVRIQT
jgi:hypothetical protein